MLLLALAMADLVSHLPDQAAIPPSAGASAPASPAPANPPPAAAPDSAATDAATPGAPVPPEPPADTAQAADGSADTVAPITASDLAGPRDPWVKANRVIFSVDTTLERHLLAPVAHGYVHVVPHFVRFHVTSALLNLEEPLTAANDLLQLRFGAFGKTFYRFVVNSTVGIAGLFDLAKTKGGVPIHYSTFGQTLGRYGVKPGPYVMLPVLGPSDVRDAFGRLVDSFLDPVQLLVGGVTTPEGASLFVMDGVDWRANADETMKAVYSATDPYAFVRSAYTQYRAANVAEATGKQQALPDFEAVPGTP